MSAHLDLLQAYIFTVWIEVLSNIRYQRENGWIYVFFMKAYFKNNKAKFSVNNLR